MANISNMVPINSGDAVLATVVSTNFNNVIVAVNSNALNSQNYGDSTVLSQHINSDAILSQHLSDSAVVSQKIRVNAVVQTHLDFASSDGGVRVVRIGDVASNMPVRGVEIARITATHSLDSVSTFVGSYSWSDAVDGNPAFTAAPVLCGEVAWQVAASSDHGPRFQMVTAIASNSAAVSYQFTATQEITATIQFAVMGPKS